MLSGRKSLHGKEGLGKENLRSDSNMCALFRNYVSGSKTTVHKLHIVVLKQNQPFYKLLRSYVISSEAPVSRLPIVVLKQNQPFYKLVLFN